MQPSGSAGGPCRRGGGCLRLLLLFTLLAGTGWLLRLPLLRTLGGYLVAGDQPAAADAILVLSGDSSERVWEAADLYREGWAPLIVLTTPETSPAVARLAARGVAIPSEPEIARQILNELGVPAEAVLQVPATVDSTAAEARNFRTFTVGRGWQRVLVVTSPFHTRRSRLLFRQVLGSIGIDVRVVPSRHGSFRGEDWWRERSGVRNLIIEYQKLFLYAIPGQVR